MSLFHGARNLLVADRALLIYRSGKSSMLFGLKHLVCERNNYQLIRICALSRGLGRQLCQMCVWLVRAVNDEVVERFREPPFRTIATGCSSMFFFILAGSPDRD